MSSHRQKPYLCVKEKKEEERERGGKKKIYDACLYANEKLELLLS